MLVTEFAADEVCSDRTKTDLVNARTVVQDRQAYFICACMSFHMKVEWSLARRFATSHTMMVSVS
jgi:hypothetical protein